MTTSPSLIACHNVNKSYGEGELSTSVLRNFNLTLNKGEDLAIIGASGSGKSTLMHLLGGLDFPDQGEITVRGEVISRMSEKARCHWRNYEVGFVYQFHHLLAEFTVFENVAMPLLIAEKNRKEVHRKVTALLDQAGLVSRSLHKPHELSGGERQRVAICRALIASPSIILADEPTGSLDSKTAQKVIDVIFDIKLESDATVVIVTHDESLAQKCTRITHLEDGKLKEY